MIFFLHESPWVSWENMNVFWKAFKATKHPIIWGILVFWNALKNNIQFFNIQKLGKKYFKKIAKISQMCILGGKKIQNNAILFYFVNDKIIFSTIFFCWKKILELSELCIRHRFPNYENSIYTRFSAFCAVFYFSVMGSISE